MDKIIIVGDNVAFWRRVVRKISPGTSITVYDKNYDGNFEGYDSLILTVDNPILAEDAIKEGVPTLCTEDISEDPIVMERIADLSEHLGTVLVSTPKFIFSDTFQHLSAAMTNIGKVKHVHINYQDHTVDPDVNILKTLGIEAFSVMIGCLDRLPDHHILAGVGYDDEDNKDWLSINMFVHEEHDKQKSVRASTTVYLSRLAAQVHKEVNVYGDKGSVVCRPSQKEVVLKDDKGRSVTKLATGTTSWEENMFKFFLEHVHEDTLNAQASVYISKLIDRINKSFKLDDSHVDLNSRN